MSWLAGFTGLVEEPPADVRRAESPTHVHAGAPLRMRLVRQHDRRRFSVGRRGHLAMKPDAAGLKAGPCARSITRPFERFARTHPVRAASGGRSSDARAYAPENRGLEVDERRRFSRRLSSAEQMSTLCRSDVRTRPLSLFWRADRLGAVPCGDREVEFGGQAPRLAMTPRCAAPSFPRAPCWSAETQGPEPRKSRRASRGNRAARKRLEGGDRGRSGRCRCPCPYVK